MTAALVTNIARPISYARSTALAMDNVGKLDAYGKLGAWNPLSLFRASEHGIVADPSDLSTLFQDSAGTTPVTADGQPVGLILDKSQGLVLGPELVTNGGLDTDLSGFSVTGGSAAWVSGEAHCVASGSGAEVKFIYAIPTVAGVTYRVVFDAYVLAGHSLYSAVGTYVGGLDLTGWAVANVTPLTKTRYEYVFKASGTTSYWSAMGYSAGTAEMFVDNVSVKELPGNNASQPTAAARPLKTSTGACHWINYDVVDDALNITFASSLGSNCTIARANVGGAPTILTGQTIGTSYADSTDNAGLVIVNRALTGQETADLTAWLTAKGATS